ncbi:M48 family metalloprotease [Persephonella sp.]|uniref:M48 family metalloprotease n=1 Tax=Persephonella sp. TaxID=2060922 RepID=UPI0026168B83|nr:M48 family metalloprotease [Persephonella sp.]
MRDKYTLFILLIGTIYLSIYLFLLKNVQLWLIDAVHCFKVMNLKEYLINHIHIFVFIVLFLLMSAFITKTLYVGLHETLRFHELKKYINLLKIKEYKNIVIIDTQQDIAFNYLNKIVISHTILKNLSKEDKKSIFLHEKGHLINKDSYKMLLSSLMLSLFPNFIKNRLTKSYILNLETKADKYALNFINNLQLAKSLLKIKTSNSYQPMMSNFTEERLKVLLENKKIGIPIIANLLIITLLCILFFSFIYKTCFCGIM